MHTPSMYTCCDLDLQEEYKCMYVCMYVCTSVIGIMHSSKPFFTAQFHPEASGGPTDTAFLFDVFLDSVRKKSKSIEFPRRKPKPETPKFKKVLLLGSGGR
jgi:hypothetical protein